MRAADPSSKHNIDTPTPFRLIWGSCWQTVAYLAIIDHHSFGIVFVST